MVKSVNINEAKTQLAQLLQRVEAGEEIIIARDGKPVARLTRLEPTEPKRLKEGWAKDIMTVSDDFDAPLPDDVLRSFYEEPIEPTD